MKGIPYSRQDITQADIDAVSEVLRSDFLTQGPAIETFERSFAERHGVAHAVALCNATAGLHIGCLALDVGPGSRVWTTPNSFVASSNCALYCGATVDFVDMDARTRNISVEALAHKLEDAKRKGTLPQVVVPVDFSGMPCDLREIRALADQYGFRIMQDASHATGASYLGQPVGSRYADLTVFSFHAVKIVTTAEGGLVTTQDEALARRLRLLRSHGITRDAAQLERPAAGPWYYEQQILGFNYRITDLQAALGSAQLRRLEAMQSRREALVARYQEALRDVPVLLPATLTDRRSAWHLYVVEVDETRTRVKRDAAFAQLRKEGIGVNVHYIAIHTQPYYERLGFRRGDFPNAERYADRALSLPLFPALTDEDQQRVIDTLKRTLA